MNKKTCILLYGIIFLLYFSCCYILPLGLGANESPPSLGTPPAIDTNYVIDLYKSGRGCDLIDYCLDKLHNKDNGSCTISVGDVYAYGIGLKKDTNKAIVYYSMTNGRLFEHATYKLAKTFFLNRQYDKAMSYAKEYINKKNTSHIGDIYFIYAISCLFRGIDELSFLKYADASKFKDTEILLSACVDIKNKIEYEAFATEFVSQLENLISMVEKNVISTGIVASNFSAEKEFSFLHNKKAMGLISERTYTTEGYVDPIFSNMNDKYNKRQKNSSNNAQAVKTRKKQKTNGPVFDVSSMEILIQKYEHCIDACNENRIEENTIGDAKINASCPQMCQYSLELEIEELEKNLYKNAEKYINSMPLK
jgi:hypothetical protein